MQRCIAMIQQMNNQAKQDGPAGPDVASLRGVWGVMRKLGVAVVKVRHAEIKDIKDILALIKGKAEFDDCLDSLLANEKSIAEAFFSNTPKSWALVAEVDSHLVGIATYYNIYSTFKAKPGIWLDDLFIFPQYRKMGIGKCLIRELCLIAQTNGCCRLDWIVARDNENGQAFYESLGAKIFEEVRHARLDEESINSLLSKDA